VYICLLRGSVGPAYLTVQEVRGDLMAVLGLREDFMEVQACGKIQEQLWEITHSRWRNPLRSGRLSSSVFSVPGQGR
jgi:hypothetical protein